MDEEGFIFLKDRIKDMIVTGSENVYPAEVEAVLMGHPEVLECAVIGVPDPKWGETVKAVVVRRAGATLTETVLIEWSRDKLAGFKRPHSVDFHRRAAAQRQRQASQAHAARAVLGRLYAPGQLRRTCHRSKLRSLDYLAYGPQSSAL